MEAASMLCTDAFVQSLGPRRQRESLRSLVQRWGLLSRSNKHQLPPRLQGQKQQLSINSEPPSDRRGNYAGIC